MHVFLETLKTFHLRKISVAIFVGVFCASCTMITSYNAALLHDGGEPRQGGGAYNLVRHVIVATVTSSESQKYNLTIVRRAIADPDYVLNVGFDHSPFADDDIEVTTENGLLQTITASSDDKTKDIILNFTKFFFSTERFAAAEEIDADGGLGALSVLVQVMFDPFDAEERADANRRLGNYGFCIAFAVDPRSSKTVGCRASRRHSGGWQQDVDKSVERDGSLSEANRNVTYKDGVFFRQPVEHKVTVYQEGHSKGCVGWCPRWDGYMAFANRGALLKVDVRRTIFVEHETTITFGPEGVPNKVKVVKPSEVLAASTLPLEISKAIIEAPVAAIAAQTSTVRAEQALIAERSKLLQTQTEYADQITELIKAGKPVPPGHDIGATLGTTPVRAAGGAVPSVAGPVVTRAAQRRDQIQLRCPQFGLDQGGCEDLLRANGLL